MPKLLVLDTESGGLDPDVHSVLSVGGVVWKDGEILGEREFLIVEDPLVVTPKALKVNRINLVEHAEMALPPDEACAEFAAFVEIAFGQELDSREKVVIVAHNAAFDIGMARRLYRLGKRSFADHFSHRSLDTAGVLRTLYLAGKVPESATTSDGAFAHFGIVFPEGERHTALGDARATAELLKRILELMRG